MGVLISSRQRFRRAPRRRFERHLLARSGPRLLASGQASASTDQEAAAARLAARHHPDGRLRTVLGDGQRPLSPRSSCRCWRPHSATMRYRSGGRTGAAHRPRHRHRFLDMGVGVSRRSNWRTMSLRRSSTRSPPATQLGTAEHSQFGYAHLIEITEHGSLAGGSRALAGAHQLPGRAGLGRRRGGASSDRAIRDDAFIVAVEA